MADLGEASVSTSSLRGNITLNSKYSYYRIFTQLYAVALMFSNVTMTNSSWTQNHISNLIQLGRRSFLSSLLNFDRRQDTPQDSATATHDSRGQLAHDPPRIVYPPCDTHEFLQLGNLASRKPIMVSLAQFRPEKDHAKQIEALALLFERHPEWRAKGVKLIMLGSCRNEEDEARIRGLKALAEDRRVTVSPLPVRASSFSELLNTRAMSSSWSMRPFPRSYNGLVKLQSE